VFSCSGTLGLNSFVSNLICSGNTYSYRADTEQALSWISATVCCRRRQPLALIGTAKGASLIRGTPFVPTRTGRPDDARAATLLKI
jgi:hypothetical protein